MARLDNFTEWEKLYKRVYIYYWLSWLCFVIGLFLYLSPMYNLPEYVVFVSAFIIVVSVYFAGYYGANKNGITSWRKRIAKNEYAIKEWATGIEYQSKLLNLQSISPLEFKRKE